MGADFHLALAGGIEALQRLGVQRCSADRWWPSSRSLAVAVVFGISQRHDER
jgi:hypothetical protein